MPQTAAAAAGRRCHGDDIDAPWTVGQTALLQEGLGRPAQTVAFSGRDRLLGQAKIDAPPRLDLDKNDLAAITDNEIDLSAPIVFRSPAPLQEQITGRFQITCRQVFAANAKLFARRPAGGAGAGAGVIYSWRERADIFPAAGVQ